MKSLVFLSILVLSTACMPQGLPAAEPSPAPVAAQPSLAATTPTRLLPSPVPLFEVLIDNVATGRQGQLYASGFGAYGDDARHFAQWDGTKWLALGNGFRTAGNSLAVDRAGHLYTEILRDSQPRQCTAIMMWEDSGWKDITGNFSTIIDTLKAGRIPCNIPVMTLATDGGDHLYAAGQFAYPNADDTSELSMSYVAKWDQKTWTVLGRGFDQVYIYGMAVSPNGRVYASGWQPRIPAGEYGMMGFIAEWDGKEWTQLGTRQLDACLNITNIVLDKAGNLYASCTPDGPGAFIFYWDGTDWIKVGDRLQGEAPAIYDMAVDQNGYLYIAGSFDSVSDVPARNIAYWDGSLWRALGEGIDVCARALAFAPGGELYAAGCFIPAGSLSAHVSRWDGETWHTLEP